MPSLDELIQHYGYAAIAVGTFLEGETILLLGGFAAARDYLRLEFVILAAFAGAVAGDQTWFQIGRHGGAAALARRPKWSTKAERIRGLLQRWDVPLILGFRFLYGLRNPIPFVVGAVGYSPWRFLGLNLVGAAVWASIIAALGYVFGQTLERVSGDIRRVEGLAALAIVAAGVTAWIVLAVRSSRRRRMAGADGRAAVADAPPRDPLS